MLRLGLVIFLAATLANANDVSLFQRQVEVKSHSNIVATKAVKHRAGACDCLNWKQTYESGKVDCGAANEMFWALKKFSKPEYETLVEAHGLADRVCGEFYSRIDDNVCMNIDIQTQMPPFEDKQIGFTINATQWNSAQWCYVSPDCTSLNGGRPVMEQDAHKPAASIRQENDQAEEMQVPAPFLSMEALGPIALKWKRCGDGDKLSRKMEPPELFNFSMKHDVNPRTMFEMSYFKYAPFEDPCTTPPWRVEMCMDYFRTLNDTVQPTIYVWDDPSQKNSLGQKLYGHKQQATWTVAMNNKMWSFKGAHSDKMDNITYQGKYCQNCSEPIG